MNSARPTLALVLGAFALCSPLAARADGAFPDGLNVLFDARHPERLAVAATFGLVGSDDAGAHWRYACEAFITSQRDVRLYQPSPDGAIFAVAASGLFRTDDGGCSWTRAGGSLANQGVTDAFVDPDDPAHVLAISFAANYRSALYESHDRGSTFGEPVFTTADVLMSVEIAKGGHGRTYLTAYRSAADGPEGWLLRADAPGGPWTETRIAKDPELGVVSRIAMVDPADPDVVYLRLSPSGSDSNDDALAISTDGGAHVSTALRLQGPMGGFARAADGTVYVGSRGGVIHRRDPGSNAFTELPGPTVRCLGVQGADLYACGDSRTDRYALAVSHDRGASFTPVLVLREIEGPLACAPVQNACASDWDALRPTLLTIPFPEVPDAGGGAVDAGLADAGAGASDAGGEGDSAPGGCGCAGVGGMAGVGVFALAVRIRRKARPG